MTTETIKRTVQNWSQEPSKAKGRSVARARLDGGRALIEAGPFSFHADLPQALGGSGLGPSPTALLIGSLAGCAVLFIRDTLAPQLGVRIDGISATASCETDARGLLGIGGVAPDLEGVSLHFQIESPDPEAAVQQVIEVWQERCPVYLALLKPTNVAISCSVTDWYAGA